MTAAGARPSSQDDGDLGEPLALTVCRLALNPDTGRIAHKKQVGIAIRGALFAELALDGRISGERMPAAIGPSETGHKLADSVHRAVAGRGVKLWRRWFSHVGADLEAATNELVRLGMWRSEGGSRYADLEPELTAMQADRVPEVLSGRVGVSSIEEVVVAVLAGGAGLRGGRPRPRARLKTLDHLLRSAGLRVFPAGVPAAPFGSVSAAGSPTDMRSRTVRGAVRSSLRAIRGTAWLRILSG
jgi:hypothetical protein